MKQNDTVSNWDNDNHIEIQLIDFQMFLSILFIGTIVISILSSYNERQTYQNKKRLWKEKTANQISLYNRAFIFILALCYLYIDYKNYDIAKKKKKDIYFLEKQLLPSFLAVIAAFILLKTVYIEQKRNPSEIATIENPIL